MSIESHIIQPDVGNVIELYDIDVFDKDGNISRSYHFTTSQFWDKESGVYSGVSWRGNTYTVIPAEVDGFRYNMEGAASQPTFTVSNVLSTLMDGINKYDQLIGASFTRWRTFSNFIGIDNEPYLSKADYIINQMSALSAKEVSFILSTAIDREDSRIPFRQVLRDWHHHYDRKYRFPGVSRSGARSR